MKRCLACQTDFASAHWRCSRCGWEPARENGRLLFAPAREPGDGLDADYCFGELAAAEPRHFWFRARRRLILWAGARHFPATRRFLDVGCGTGFVLLGLQEIWPGAELSGAELRADALAFVAQRAPRACLFQLDARRLPFSGEFDAIGAFDVIEHVDEDESVLAEMFRATRVGGGVILTVPQHRFLWSAVDEQSRHRRRYSRRELARKLRGAGFEILRLTSFCTLLLPLLLANRWRLRLSRRPCDLRSELALGAANDALERIMRIEERVIQRGLDLPLGGSLLAVGRRVS